MNPTHTSPSDVRRLYWEAANNQALGTSLLTNPRWKDCDVAEKQQIDEVLPPLEGHRVLELGAGIGRFTTGLAERAATVTVVDLSEQALQENQKRNRHFSNLTYICDSVANLKFRPDTFDLIFSNWLLMYLYPDEIQTLLTDCRVWVKPDGHVFFRESCEHTYAGQKRDWFLSMEAVRSVLPFLGQPVYSLWRYRFPSFSAFWRVLAGRDAVRMYRPAAFYETRFACDFNCVEQGHIAVYEQAFGNPHQRYWLLSPEPGGEV